MKHDIDFGSPAWRRHRELDNSRLMGILMLVGMGFSAGMLHVAGVF